MAPAGVPNIVTDKEPAMTPGVAPGPAPAAGSTSGSTGRRPIGKAEKRLAKNVLWSWGGQLVYIISGFILPRAIDHMGGKSVLGVWDFAWSLVTYLYLVELGVSSSVNRFVAKHLAEKDFDGLNRSISSVICIQLVVGTVIMLLSVFLVYLIPLVAQARLGSSVRDAQWVVFFLGAAMAQGFAFGGFAGVVTGSHRWDLYNIINAAGQAIGLAGMLLSLSIWHSIRMLGVMYAASGTIQALGLLIAAHRVCPSLKVRFRFVDRAAIATMLRFGGKTFMNGLARSFLYQTTAVFMTAYLGPAALAVYNRPLALVNQLRAMCGKFANTLTPIASELQAAGRHDSLQDMARRMAGVGAALSLPPVVFLSVMGGCILRVWMGAGYADNLLPVILAVGNLWAIANMPLQTILIGLDAHGPTALVSVLSSAACAAACWLLLGVAGVGLHPVSVCVALTLLLTDGAYVTFYTCRRIGVSPWKFLRQVWSVPLLCVAPFALCLLAARLFLPPLWALACGVAAGAVVLPPTYWRWIFSGEIRAKIRRKLRLVRLFRAPGVEPLP